MRMRTFGIAAGMMAAMALSPAAPALAQGDGATTIDCSLISPELGGTIVFTPSGNLLGNCWEHTHGDQGADGGSATIVECEEALETENTVGIQVITPTGGVYTNCHVHVRN